MPDADLTEKIARVVWTADGPGEWENAVKEAGLWPHGSVAHRVRRARATAAEVAAVVQDEVDDELERLRSWSGLLSLLDERWPVDVFPVRDDDPDRDPGPRILSLVRRLGATQVEVERLRAGIAALVGRRPRDTRLAALLEPPRPRITTTWGEPDGIGGPRKGTELCPCGIPKASHERQAAAGAPVTHTWDMDGSPL